MLRKSNAQIDITADGRIRSMALPQNQIPDEIFACVACFPELEELTINYADVDDFRLQYLAGLSNLKRLVLHDTDISDEGLAILGRLTSLEHLDLSESRLVGWGFAHLKSLDNLTSLDLNRNWWLSGVALEQLDQLKRLERLDLSGNDRIHPEHSGTWHASHRSSLSTWRGRCLTTTPCRRLQSCRAPDAGTPRPHPLNGQPRGRRATPARPHAGMPHRRQLVQRWLSGPSALGTVAGERAAVLQIGTSDQSPCGRRSV